MQPNAGGALSGEVRAALLRVGNQLADTGLRGAALATALENEVFTSESRRRTLAPGERALIAQGAQAVAAQWQQIDTFNEGVGAGFAFELEAPLLPGSVPGTTADVVFTGDLGTGKGPERIFLRLTDLDTPDQLTILARVRDAWADIVGASGDPEHASLDESSLQLRGLYRG